MLYYRHNELTTSVINLTQVCSNQSRLRDTAAIGEILIAPFANPPDIFLPEYVSTFT